jgi:aspartate/methionine/tyrosine aminotransferase
MTNLSENRTSPSALAMERFIEKAPGLRQPQIAVPMPGLPTLPDLKKLARDRRAAGHAVIDQSAGDIDDVGQPLSDNFPAWIEEARDRIVAEGCTELRRTTGDAFGFPGNYQQQYPAVMDVLVASWGVRETPVRTIQTVSGRTAIDLVFRGLAARADEAGKDGRRALIFDTLEWSGYRPLARALDLEMVHAPAIPKHGLSSSAEGLEAALAFARDQDLTPIATVPILPSNPTGVGMERTELARFVETAAAADLPVMIDAFYSPLVPEGHAEAVPLGFLEQELAPEALAYLGVLVGETKVTSSQNKTGTMIWMAPAGHDGIANTIIDAALTRMRAINGYPRPQDALVAYALHTFPGGVHAAMGPRYIALDETRRAMRAACDAYDLPFSIGGSFYGTAALVDAEGQSLIRDDQGRPITDPKQVSELLINQFGLVGAPGGMFAPAPESASMVRLTAAVTLEDVEKVRGIFGELVAAAK